MRSERRMSRGLGFATIFLMTLGALVMIQPSRAEGSQDLRVIESDGNHWIIGCVTQNVAERLVAHAGFTLGNGPIAILCIVDTVSVSKQLN